MLAEGFRHKFLHPRYKEQNLVIFSSFKMYSSVLEKEEMNREREYHIDSRHKQTLSPSVSKTLRYRRKKTHSILRGNILSMVQTRILGAELVQTRTHRGNLQTIFCTRRKNVSELSRELERNCERPFLCTTKSFQNRVMYSIL